LSAVGLVLSVASQPVSAADARDAVNSAVNFAVRTAKRTCGAIGVHVVDLSSGETVYAYNADRRRVIASNTKLFTTAAALDRLGPGYQFETEVLTHGPIEAGVLRGDVAVVGGGDPSISGRAYQGDALAPLHRWASALSERGIRRIEGDLVLVDGLFQGPEVHPDWPENQLAKWYEAPVSALSFEDNCTLVRIWPGATPGAAAQVELVPRLPVFDLETTAKTTSSSGRHKVGVTRGGDEDRLTVWGSVYTRAGPVETWVAVKDPVDYFGMAFQKALADRGIELTGGRRRSRDLPPGNWTRALVHRSDLLSALEVINKRSQNFYAESVIKLLGALGCGRGDWEGGTRVVEEFLARLGIPAGQYRMADGSGMSRNNQFTPRHLTTLLGEMFEHRWSREFVGTLPHSGERDLSWEKRLADAPYGGNVFAKTGRLRGVSTLSGYAKARSGRVYAFSLLFNECRSDWAAKDSHDEVVKAIVDRG
jgi:D-alanyl-D-alanine carboxypeptidase/D-alanyl-D-alanine-endopeptidase (penicillin-binding protein 4)